MAFPLAIAGAMMVPSIVSGIMGYLNDSEANEVSAQERKKLEGLLAQVQSPQFSPEQLTPESYRVLQQYVPQVASFVQEVAPNVVTGDTAEARQGKDIEQQVLQEMLGISQDGTDATTDIQLNRAKRASDDAASSARATADATQARRGFQPGGALSYALSQDATNQGLQRNAMAGEQAVMDAAGRRTDALGQVGRMGTQMTGRANDMEKANAAIMNAFNEHLASNRNQYNQYAAGVQNQGQQFNIGQNQGAFDKSVAGRNQAQQFNMNRGDDIVRAQTAHQMNKLGQQSNITGMARQDATNAADTSNRAWNAGAQAVTAGLGAANQAGAFAAAPKPEPQSTTSVDLDPNKRYAPKNPYGYA